MAKMATKGAKQKGPAQPGSQGPNARSSGNMGYSHGKIARKSNKSSNTTGKGCM